jgi:hypothetical protein
MLYVTLILNNNGPGDVSSCPLLLKITSMVILLPHKMNRDRKSLLKTIETERSDLANRTVRFCRDQ